jgi:pimeloyl-ACP methyl ester carboxylesterase
VDPPDGTAGKPVPDHRPEPSRTGRYARTSHRIRQAHPGAFHSHVEIAHLLISGRERAYFEYFIRSRIEDDAVITPADIDGYAMAYAAPGALLSALEMYRSLTTDREMNLAALAAGGRLAAPVAAVASATRATRASVEEILQQIAMDGRAVMVDRCGHWIPQERPDVLADVVVAFSRR